MAQANNYFNISGNLVRDPEIRLTTKHRLSIVLFHWLLPDSVKTKQILYLYAFGKSSRTI